MRPRVLSLLLLVALAPAARAAECTCEHLPAIQAELRNAQRLQTAFRNQIAALRALGPGASQGALQQFAAGDARHGLEAVPGYNGPSGFDSFSADQLCTMAESAARRLEQAERATACDGIAAALRAHENVHLQM